MLVDFWEVVGLLTVSMNEQARYDLEIFGAFIDSKPVPCDVDVTVQLFCGKKPTTLSRYRED